MSTEDHDILIRIDANLANMKTMMDAHVLADTSAFKSLNSSVGWLQKIIFMGLGAVALFKIFYK